MPMITLTTGLHTDTVATDEARSPAAKETCWTRKATTAAPAHA